MSVCVCVYVYVLQYLDEIHIFENVAAVCTCSNNYLVNLRPIKCTIFN
jgi:hypothetical protein